MVSKKTLINQNKKINRLQNDILDLNEELNKFSRETTDPTNIPVKLIKKINLKIDKYNILCQEYNMHDQMLARYVYEKPKALRINSKINDLKSQNSILENKLNKDTINVKIEKSFILPSEIEQTIVIEEKVVGKDGIKSKKSEKDVFNSLQLHSFPYNKTSKARIKFYVNSNPKLVKEIIINSENFENKINWEEMLKRSESDVNALLQKLEITANDYIFVDFQNQVSKSTLQDQHFKLPKTPYVFIPTQYDKETKPNKDKELVSNSNIKKK